MTQHPLREPAPAPPWPRANTGGESLPPPSRPDLAVWVSRAASAATLLGYLTRLLDREASLSVHLLPVFAVGFVALGLALRLRAWRGTALDGLVFLMLATLTLASHLTGGLTAPVLAVLPIVPLTATFTAGVRKGWWAVAWSAVCVLVLIALRVAGLATPHPATPWGGPLLRVAVLLSASAIITAIIRFYERELDRLRKLLKSSAMSDDLTGLANRGALDDTLALEHHRLSRYPVSTLALVLFDVDHFKEYNDRYGHQAADDCLKLVADTAGRRVRRATDLLARYGGDEMLAVLPATSRGEAATLAECIRRDVESLARPHEASPHGIVTVSLGVATAAADAIQSVDALLSSADAALAKAKRAGRNTVSIAD